ncbi:GTP-binding protein Era [Longilinea arvoryzae]|uniref:GTPase Era n=1 Tax=Longilinea arvoryzae TaxID=360412 RepID=A0A0S7BJ88_9CHLR|nr:GTPase Era [Longilinea arvoryzae]GAP13921.1 GTP-binding protein Era [Longilinea arvoryzae]
MSHFRAGFVTLVGRPNVGKSTLMNGLLGQKVAAVSPRPQTTRRRQLGILSRDDCQIIFMDTPGLHKPVHKLGEYMNETAAATLEDADIIVWLVDASQPPQEEDRLIAERLEKIGNKLPPVLLAVNKIDSLAAENLSARSAEFQSLRPTAEVFPLSAANGAGCDALLARILSALPEGQPYYDPDQITDLYERDIAADLIRESALRLLRDEVPHGIAVRIDEFKERSEEQVYIGATLFVERESHKGIVIGQGASMLKQIGTAARQEIEAMSGRHVYLELRVKVNKNWRDDPNALRLFGFVIEKEEE